MIQLHVACGENSNVRDDEVCFVLTIVNRLLTTTIVFVLAFRANWGRYGCVVFILWTDLRTVYVVMRVYFPAEIPVTSKTHRLSNLVLQLQLNQPPFDEIKGKLRSAIADRTCNGSYLRNPGPIVFV